MKRLSERYEQAAVELKNEVVLVAKLHHRNLVRVLGFCVKGEDKLIVYEYNKSLDYFLFGLANLN
jgi:serine/threonine protein kinase